MGEPFRSRPARRTPADPRARERLREAQVAEAHAVAEVCAAEAKVATTIAKRDKARLTADAWVTEANEVLDRARAGLVSVSGLDRAALLLGIARPKLRRSLTSGSSRDGAA